MTSAQVGPDSDARVDMVAEVIGNLAGCIAAEGGIVVLVPAWSPWAVTEARIQLAAALERIGVPTASRLGLTERGHDSLLVAGSLPSRRCLVVDVVAIDQLRVGLTRRVGLLVLNDDWTLGSDRTDLLVEASQILHVRDLDLPAPIRRVRAKGAPAAGCWGEVPIEVRLAGGR